MSAANEVSFEEDLILPGDDKVIEQPSYESADLYKGASHVFLQEWIKGVVFRVRKELDTQLCHVPLELSTPLEYLF